MGKKIKDQSCSSLKQLPFTLEWQVVRFVEQFIKLLRHTHESSNAKLFQIFR